MTLVLIGLIGGIITGVSPCVLPVLPVIFLGGGSAEPDAESSRRRPYLIVLGLTLSFAAITLFGTVILAGLHLPPDAIRWLGLALGYAVGTAIPRTRESRCPRRPASPTPLPPTRTRRRRPTSATTGNSTTREATPTPRAPGRTRPPRCR